MSIERSHLSLGLVYSVIGISLGTFMAASQNHGQHVTHAHLLLVGFLLSVIYAIVYRLWLSRPRKVFARIQFGLHHLGVVLMTSGLFIYYGGFLAHDRVEPLLAISALLVLTAMLLMLVMVVTSRVPDSEEIESARGVGTTDFGGI